MSIATWLDEVQLIAGTLDRREIDRLVAVLKTVRDEGGRVFVLGLGGSAANASHCVNDLRVRARLEAYAPTDNIAEFSARCNDELDGWVNVFARWLDGSRLRAHDAVLILSGSGESQPLVAAARYAYEAKAHVLGILGAKGTSVGKYCRVAVIVPSAVPGQREAFQAVVWHAVVEELAS